MTTGRINQVTIPSRSVRIEQRGLSPSLFRRYAGVSSTMEYKDRKREQRRRSSLSCLSLPCSLDLTRLKTSFFAFHERNTNDSLPRGLPANGIVTKDAAPSRRILKWLIESGLAIGNLSTLLRTLLTTRDGVRLVTLWTHKEDPAPSLQTSEPFSSSRSVHPDDAGPSMTEPRWGSSRQGVLDEREEARDQAGP